jgi:hypothetical protein
MQQANILKKSDNNPAPDNAEMKRSPTMLYGKKKEHANEGVFVSLLKNDDGTLKLFCNGLSKKETYNLKITNGDQTLFEKTTDERELNIPITVSNGVKVDVTYGTKTATKIFRLLR